MPFLPLEPNFDPACIPTPLQAITLGFRPFRHRKSGDIQFVRTVLEEVDEDEEPEFVQDAAGFAERLEFFREDYEEMDVCEFIRKCSTSSTNPA